MDCSLIAKLSIGFNLRRASVSLALNPLIYFMLILPRFQFSFGDFALTSVRLPLLPFVYFVLTPVDSSAAFNPLGEFPSILQPFKVNAAIRNAFQRF